MLGIGETITVSAYHGRNVAELLDKVIALLPPSTVEETEKDVVKVAIVGRPGVGKSMLLNALLGKERALVSETPGTTRDALDTRFDFNGRHVILIDTAGIRRRGKQEVGVEKFSVIRSLRAIERADVVLLVMDATDMLAAQDLHIAGYIRQESKGIILIVNKWDIAPVKDKAEYGNQIQSRLKFMPYAPVLYTSAKQKRGIEQILPLVLGVHHERNRRLSDAELNTVVQQALTAHTPPRSGNRQLKILDAAQTETSPPTIVFYVNHTGLAHFSYQRYLENRLRAAFGFVGTPIKMLFKARGGK
jgi:GTP-binding protein